MPSSMTLFVPGSSGDFVHSRLVNPYSISSPLSYQTRREVSFPYSSTFCVITLPNTLVHSASVMYACGSSAMMTRSTSDDSVGDSLA